MSCHDIGRGLNSVVRRTITLYDEGKVSAEVTKEIINACAKGVHWCDGNEDEATAYIRDCRCGNCLKIVPKGEKLYSVWSLPLNHPSKTKVGRLDKELACDKLCEDCFPLVVGTLGDTEFVDTIRQDIEQYMGPERLMSSGEHPEQNNGYSW